MKYQIILESSLQYSDQEFHEIIKFALFGDDNIPENFKLIEARSLEGIRKEVWQKANELSGAYEEIHHTNFESDSQVNETYEKLKKLFT